MIEAQMIDEAVRRLLEAAPPGSQVILFGSYARGNANENSDLDFLVVEPMLNGRRQEMVRLRQVLRPMGVPVEVLVVSQDAFDRWKDLPNNVVFQAAREGRSFTRAA